ncbi:MAG TPA: ferritin family protein, partial [Bacteroidales bacterium]|nr:ferritin family protein [Bacteroidales bacterium]
MKTFQTIDEILDFAMEAEQEAVDFYLNLAQMQKNRQIADVFIEFAKEEVKHKARLKKIKEEKAFQFEVEKIADLRIADYVVAIKPTAGMDYADALALAMKKEKAAYKLYMALAQRTTEPFLVKAFHA